MVDLSTLISPNPGFPQLNVISINDRGEIAGIGVDASDNTHSVLLIPCDEYHPGMDYTSDAAMARFGFALGWEAANQARLVGWRKGDEFERARLASQ